MDRCFLCGKEEAKFSDCFVPSVDYADWLMGKSPKGETNILFIWFGLCDECFNLRNREGLVGKKIESDARRAGYKGKFGK